MSLSALDFGCLRRANLSHPASNSGTAHAAWRCFRVGLISTMGILDVPKTMTNDEKLRPSRNAEFPPSGAPLASILCFANLGAGVTRCTETGLECRQTRPTPFSLLHLLSPPTRMLATTQPLKARASAPELPPALSRPVNIAVPLRCTDSSAPRPSRCRGGG